MTHLSLHRTHPPTAAHAQTESAQTAGLSEWMSIFLFSLFFLNSCNVGHIFSQPFCPADVFTGSKTDTWL